MPDLSSANVTVIAAWTTGGTTGRRNKVRHVSWTSTTAGGTTDKLLASAFGFTRILRCSNVQINDKIYPAVPSADGSCVLLADAAGTAANHANAANLATGTDSAYITLEGY